MNLSEFKALLHAATGVSDQQQQQLVYEAYDNFVKQNADTFLQHICEIVKENNDDSTVAVIIFRKNIMYNKQESALFGCQNAQIILDLLHALIQFAIQSKKSIVAQTIGIYSTFFEESQELTTIVLDFIEQCLATEPAYQLLGSTTLEQYLGQTVKTIGGNMNRALSLVQKVFETTDARAAVSFIECAHNVIAESQFLDDGDDAIDLQIQKELILASVHKVMQQGQLLEAHPQNMPHFIKMLDKLCTVLDQFLAIVADSIDTILDLVEAIVTAGDEVSRIGCTFVESFANQQDVAFSGEQLDWMAQITTHIFDILVRNSSSVRDLLEGATDYVSTNEESYEGFASMAIRAACAQAPEQLHQVFIDYCAAKNDGSSNFKAFVVFFLECEFLSKLTQQDSELEFVQSVLAQIDQDPLVRMRITSALKRVFCCIESVSRFETASLILPFIQQCMDCETVFVADAINLLISAIMYTDIGFLEANIAFVVQIVVSFCGDQSNLLQIEILNLISLILQKYKTQLLDEQILMYSNTFLGQAHQITVGLKTQEIKYFAALIAMITSAVVYSDVLNDSRGQIIHSLIEILSNPCVDEIHLFADVIFEALCSISLRSGNELVPYLDFLFEQFLKVLKIKHREDCSNLASENKFKYNSFIVTQHKLVFKAISSIFINHPISCYHYLDEVTDVVITNQYQFYDFKYIIAVICGIILCRAEANDQIGFQDSLSLFKMKCDTGIFKDDEFTRCTDEVTEILQSIVVLFKAFRIATEKFKYPIQAANDYVIEVINALLQHSTSSIGAFCRGLVVEGKEADQYKKLLQLEYSTVYLCCDALSDVIQQIFILKQGDILQEALDSFDLHEMLECYQAVIFKFCLNDSFVCNSFTEEIVELVRSLKENLVHKPMAELAIIALSKIPPVEEIINNVLLNRQSEFVEQPCLIPIALKYSLLMIDEQMFHYIVELLLQQQVSDGWQIIFKQLWDAHVAGCFNYQYQVLAVMVNCYFEHSELKNTDGGKYVQKQLELLNEQQRRELLLILRSTAKMILLG